MPGTVPLKDKLLAGALGLIAVLLFCELGLRILGSVYYVKSHHKPRPAEAKTLTLLCLGDSYTFGIGAPAGLSYPEQLQKLLNSQSRDKKFLVLNRGQGGQNTTQLLEELPHNLKELNPDMIILMSGSANSWNHYGLRRYLQSGSWSARWQNLAYRIRVLKLAKLLGLQLQQKYALWLKHTQTVNTGKNTDSYYRRGFDCLDRKNYQEALQWFNKGIAVNPGDSRCYFGAGRVQQELQHYDEAILNFNQALELDKTFRQIHDLVICYCKIQHFQQALELADKALQANPGQAYYYFLKGEIYQEMGRYDEALFWLKKSYNLNPGNLNYHIIGVVFQMQGKYPQAIQWFTRQIHRHPERLENYLSLGETYFLAGQYDKALHWYQAGRALKPSNAETFCRIGRVYKSLRDYPQALHYYRQALQLDPAVAGRAQSEIKDLEEDIRHPKDSAQSLRDKPGKASNPGLPPGPDLPWERNTEKPEEYLIRDWIRSDLQTIIAQCLEHKVKVILMNFPRNLNVGSLSCKTMLAGLARENRITLVDNQAVFCRLPDPESYFAPDGHCNAKGYGVIARNLYATLRRGTPENARP